MNISKKLKENIETLKSILKDCDDIIYRKIEIGDKDKTKACLIFVDGLVDKSLISEYAIQVLLQCTESKDNMNINMIKTNFLDRISAESIAVHDVKEEEDLDKIVDEILVGETALLVDNCKKGLILSSRGWPTRGIAEPETETVVRGPRDGFGETMRFNTALVRRRIRDPKMKLKATKVGRRSKTDIAIVYIEDIVNEKILQEVMKRIDEIDIDSIGESSTLEALIEDDYLSPFPQIESTERPDAVAASLYEGRVGIIVDNTPFALIVPATLGTLFQSTEDYYSRWPITSVIRIIRIICAFLSVLAPALYIAISSFHPGLIPTVLTFYLAASRVNVPFPVVIEAFLMEITIEILRESGTRIAGPIGSTIGIVGGLIVGQAAVEAGIVSPLMIIIVAITTMASFALPNYQWASGLRICRFAFMVLAAVLGLYGIMLGVVILFAHFAKLKSFGVPFASPYSGLGIKEGDLKDTLIKAPLQRLRFRPKFTFPRDKKRM
ncbi:spore germination protein [Schnuerera sp. xch1]|uniref:spore germination protein n=1 Tax=Schnuerera sp. xch1 TaxID=2874283 RepID=UPI001CBD5A20|nr:spore germination protein [Schnuerera sp. xch1]MBZ2175089.1 spore germination protein [Schnuerera sp. xch1]